MKLVIEYKDKETPAPKVIMDEDGKIEQVVFDVPFALIQKSKLDENDERVIVVKVGQTKPCTGPCKQERSWNEFHYSSTHRDGKQNVCIACKKDLEIARRRRLMEAEDAAE